MNTTPVPSLRRALRVLGQAASLSVWRRPRSRVELLGFGAFLLSCVLAMLCFIAQDRITTDAGVWYFDGWYAHAGYYLAVLAGAWLATRVLARPALWLNLATLALLIGIPWTAAAVYAEIKLVDALWFQQYAWRALLAMAGFVALFRLVGFLSDAPPARRLLATFALLLVVSGPWYWQQSAWFWYDDDGDETTDVDETAPAPNAPQPPPAPDDAAPPVLLDGEAVLYRQPELLRHAVESIRAQTPGKIDLYAVGFAGDGEERVFRNEVEFYAKLMSTRFDATGRTLSLINSPKTVDTVPLATLSNLRAGLADVAARMDTNEDVLVLFLTSHGSHEHRLYVSMPPLPLHQIEPADLRAALDDAGIRWRVVVVSACYSGGFIDALRDPRTLVITAARADRTSFGCGAESRITWFGHAFLTEGLNQTTDFERAFSLADHQIRSWELAQGETPSVPQIAVGSEIGGKLAAWRAGAAPGDPVPFTPQ